MEKFVHPWEYLAEVVRAVTTVRNRFVMREKKKASKRRTLDIIP